MIHRPVGNRGHRRRDAVAAASRALLAALFWAAALTARPEEVEDIQYLPQGTSPQTTLSAFLPARTTGAPILTFFHGGGWRSGDKSDLYDFARRLADEGVIVVLPNYRLAPASRHPAQAEDAAAAVAWVAARLSGWAADARCHFLGGHSAGGHLAALLATADEFLAARDLSPRAIAGVVGVSGVYRIAPQEGGATREFVASVFGDEEAVWQAASPTRRLSSRAPGAALPPFALVWSESEHPLAVKESVEFARALRRSGGTALEERLSRGEHGAGLDQVSGRLLTELAGGVCRAPTGG